MLFIAILFGLVVVYLVVEYRAHERRLRSIPVRIHVNGTRGKSSVTRLIAGALREHGVKVYAKTTGTLPRMIMEDGSEYPIYRPAKANVIEQLRIVALAAGRGAEALVIECMAVQPVLQALTELKLIKATHGIITNARADHLDVMGPTERDVALALLGTVPKSATLFTAERDYLPLFQYVCDDRSATLEPLGEEELQAVADEEMAAFGYIEHRENVALALKVCGALEVPRDVALRGMWRARPDAGVLTEHELNFFGREIVFVNGFAANDPESTERIWRMALEKHQGRENKIMILNLRSDRPDRSKQLGDALLSWPPADHYILMGSGVYAMLRHIAASGLGPSRFVSAESMSIDQIFEEVIGLVGRSALVMGVGNIGSHGLELVEYFRHRALPP